MTTPLGSRRPTADPPTGPSPSHQLNPPVTAIKTSKTNNIQAKQTTTLNKVHDRLNPFWILLDNQSTVNIFYKAIFLRNIWKVDKELHLYTNAGVSTTNEVGDLQGFGTVWLHRGGIANILSLNLVKSKGFQVDYNSAGEDAFVITKKNDTTRKFTPSANGLYCIDTSDEF